MSWSTWSRAISPVPYARTTTFVVRGRERGAVERDVLTLGARPDEHWRYHLVNTQLGSAARGGSRRQWMARATVDLRGRQGDVEVTATYRELGVQAASLLFHTGTVVGLLLFVSGLGFAHDGAGSVVGWSLSAGALLLGSAAPWCGRYRERALVVGAQAMDASLRRALGADAAPPAPVPSAPVSSRSARRFQAVAVVCAVASIGLTITRFTLSPDQSRSPTHHGVIWSHVAIENQLKVFDGAASDVVCNGGRDIHADHAGQQITCHDSTRGDYTLIVADAADERFSVTAGLTDPASS